MNIHVRNLTPTQIESIERSKRFHAAIKAKAHELAAHVEPEIIQAVAPIKPAPVVKAIEPEAMPAETDPPRVPWFSMVDVPRYSVRQIQQETCEFYGVFLKDMLGPRRQKELVIPRHTAMYLAMELTDFSLPNLGRMFGNKDHTSLVNCRKKVRQRLKADADYAFEIAVLIKSLTGVQQ